MKNGLLFWCAAVLIGISIWSCLPMSNNNHTDVLVSVPNDHWAKLAQRSVYFGHQSVGENIIYGLRHVLVDNPNIKLQLSSDAKSTQPLQGLVEFRIGKNGDAASKNSDFVATLAEHPLGPRPILMFKYCYVDINETTDVQKMFRDYQQTVTLLRAAHPEATIVHITVPLMKGESTIRFFANRVRGYETIRPSNWKRNQFDDLMRSAYKDKEPIFDLAAVESTHADGSREFSRLGLNEVFELAPEWTSDGGHLNLEGAKRAAERLLVNLASL